MTFRSQGGPGNWTPGLADIRARQEGVRVECRGHTLVSALFLPLPATMLDLSLKLEDQTEETVGPK